jgi:prevent-host-death family protein
MAKQQQVDLRDAKRRLSCLVEVAAGKHDVVLTKAGKPVALLTRLRRDTARRTPGALKGKIRIADDFDAPLPAHVTASFEGAG